MDNWVLGAMAMVLGVWMSCIIGILSFTSIGFCAIGLELTMGLMNTALEDEYICKNIIFTRNMHSSIHHNKVDGEQRVAIRGQLCKN